MIYVVPKGLSQGIVYSQIYQPAKGLKKKGIKSVIAIHNDFKDAYNDISEIDVCYFSKYNELFPIIKKTKRVYTRMYIDFFNIYILTFFQNIKIHYSFRGLVFTESFYRNKNLLKASIIYILEFMTYILADELSCVSKQMKIHLSKYFFLNRKIEVSYCGISEVFLKKEFNEKLHFVYIGGISKWQKIEEAILVYKYISKNINRPTQLSIVTPEIKKIHDLLSKTEQKLYSIEIISLKPNEVSDYLRSCDFGFLLRDKSIVNKLASPVKFLEYTSNGVVPIISDEIGDYSLDVENKVLGICLKNYDKIDHSIIDELNQLLKDSSLLQRLFSYSNNFLWHK